MFEGMTGTQQQQVYLWFAHAFVICFIAHCLRFALKDFWNRRVSPERRRNNSDSPVLNDFAQNTENGGKSAEKPPKSTELTESDKTGKF